MRIRYLGGYGMQFKGDCGKGISASPGASMRIRSEEEGPQETSSQIP